MIAVVGLGVIGASYAMAFKRLGIQPVAGIDTDEKTLQIALDSGLIEEGSQDGRAILQKSKLVILALYPTLVPTFLRMHRDDFAPNCLITDVTGVKSEIAAQVDQLLRDDVDLVLGHPMAGREKMGIAFASDQVFQGANYIIAPIARNSEAHMAQIEALARAIGFQSVRRVSPEAHDELIAYTSQLPHLMAVALVNSDVEERDTGRFIGDSYRDLTRIARINGALWSELFLENKRALLPVMDQFGVQMQRLYDALLAEDRAALLEMFEASTRRRDHMDA